MKTRFSCFLLILLIIATGLLSRKINSIPLWIGDALYATMMYFIVRFIFIRKSSIVIAAVSLSICYLIEFSQLYQVTWIKAMRATLPGRLILGQGFLWTDLAAYALGIATGAALELLIKNRKTNTL